MNRISSKAASLSDPTLTEKAHRRLIKKIAKLVDKVGVDDGVKAFFLGLKKGQHSLLTSSFTDDAINAIVKEADIIKSVGWSSVKGSTVTFAKSSGGISDDAAQILLDQFDEALKSIDGLSDDIEALNGTLARERDTDGDGFSDGLEYLMGSDATEVLSIPNFNVPQPPQPGDENQT